VAQEKLKQVTPPGGLTRPHQDEIGKVTVVYGVHAIEAGLAGRTVLSVREALAQPLNISPRAVALVNGQEVESTHVLNPGELLEFVRYAGEKGTESTETSRPTPNRIRWKNGTVNWATVGWISPSTDRSTTCTPCWGS